MSLDISEEAVRFLRLRGQRLYLPDHKDDATVAGVIHGLGGLQAQASEAAALGVRVRSRGLTAADVERARLEERTIVRTWSMRGTLHLVHVEHLPGLLSVFGELYVSRGRRRLAELGLDHQACERSMTVIREALAAHGPLTRIGLAQRLVEAGIEVAKKSQAPVHLVRRACLLGIACQVAPIDGKDAYALLHDWLAPDSRVDRDKSLAELAHRYLKAYGPATARDFAAWSGLPMADVRVGWNALSDGLVEVNAGGRSASMLEGGLEDPRVVPSDARQVRLLPAFDTYLLGYQDRRLAVAAEHDRRVLPGGGVLRPTVISSGRAIGTWSMRRSGKLRVAQIQPFEPLDPALEQGLRTEMKDIGRFQARPLRFELPV